MKFRATVELGGKTATGIEVPERVVKSLGSHRRPPVRVTINGKTYRSTIAVMGGRFMVGVSAENRALTGVEAGDKVQVDIELDDAPRVVEIPPDLAKAFERAPVAKRRFETLSHSHKRQHVLAIEGAKKPETRDRRVAKTIEVLTGD